MNLSTLELKPSEIYGVDDSISWHPSISFSLETHPIHTKLDLKPLDFFGEFDTSNEDQKG